MTARPTTVWMIAAKGARHEWLMYWTAGKTKKSARLSFAAQFGDAERGLSVFADRLAKKQIRYTRVTIQEQAP